MSMATEKLKVVFRKYKDGTIIALFPTIKCDNMGHILSYEHIGQHCSASPLIVHETKLATEEEYTPLLNELKQIYNEYTLVTRKKLNLY